MTALSRKLDVAMCLGCLQKMREIDRLRRKLKKKSRRITALEKKLGERARSPEETPFGESTPSSKLPFKTNATEKNRQRKGGAKPGHRGHGRKKPPPESPAEKLAAPCSCPDCGGITFARKVEDRYVQDYIPERTVQRHLLVESRQCRHCGKLTEAVVPDILPRAKYSNTFIANAACQHYLDLKRDAEELQKQLPDDPEVKCFCRALIRQLSAAMRLRSRKLSDRRYYGAAAHIKARIVGICESDARHPGIQELQNLFRKNRHRLYHWAHDRRVPADNNYSERSLRPLVIARKLSFGTQSAKGSRTRSILTSVLHSLKKQGHDPATRICDAMDLNTHTPEADLVDFLFPSTWRLFPVSRSASE